MRILPVHFAFFFLLLACSGPPALSTLRLTYVGTYQTIRGGQDPLGCFCPGGGYITSCGGQRIPLCFVGEPPPEGCESLEVRGKYRDGVADTPPDSLCPEGVFRYLLVEEWRCLK
jgi:hypothetical protein